MTTTSELDDYKGPDEVDKILAELQDHMVEVKRTMTAKAKLLTLKKKWQDSARLEELKALIPHAEFVSDDRIDMVGLHIILDRIDELTAQAKGK